MKQVMVKALITAVIVVTVSLVKVPAQPESKLDLRDVSTNKNWINPDNDPRFIGCPYVTYRVQGPGETVKVDAVWSDVLEGVRVELDKKTFQREHITALTPRDKWVLTKNSPANTFSVRN